MNYVRLTKIDKTDDARYETPTKEDFIEYKPVGTPFVGYWTEGFLIAPVSVGSTVWIDRRVKNGEPAVGDFRTSVIKKIVGDEIHTLNSVYLLTVLK